MYTYLIRFFYKQKRAVCLILILIVTYFIRINLYTQIKNGYKLNTVVIDAGHGGKDFGAIGKKSREKDIVLNIALKTGKYIEENVPDVKVIYTRKTDVFIPLHERAEIANKNNADLFISIHANANPSPKPYGTETYAMGLHKSEENLEVAKLENSAILYEENYNETYEGFDPNSAESYIIFSLIQNSNLEQSIGFASFIQDEFRTRAQRKDRGVKQAGFLVLWKTTMPSVLIETGFISNLKEEKYLASEEGQTYIASAIYRAFKEYKKWYDEVNKPEIASNQPDISAENETINVENSNIVFKIQVSSSTKQVPLDSPVFRGLIELQEIEYNGIYKYTVGNENDFKNILKQRENIKDRFPDAFIIALKNGKIIPLNEALKEINQ